MKKNDFFNILVVMCLSLIFVACSDKQSKKKNGKQDTRKERNKENGKRTGVSITEKNEEIIDIANKGIGPIKELTFDDLDKDMAEKGGIIFKQKCTACHKTDKKLIGPSMKGIYKKRAPEWVMNMMLNPTEMLKKDPIAIQQLKDYNNVMMIDQNLSNDEARAIAEFLRTIK